MTITLYLFFILLIGQFSGGRTAASYDVYQLVSSLDAIGDTNNLNDNSYVFKTEFSSMSASNQMHVIGKKQITIGSWLKVIERTGEDVSDIGIFQLWSTQNNGWLHALYKNYITTAPNNRCVSKINDGGTEHFQIYDRTQSPPCGFVRGYWYHIATALDFSTEDAFKAQIAFYDPKISDYWSRSYITWAGTSTIGSYTFQATDYIALRFAGNNDYPAIDCMFSATFAIPYYITYSSFNFAFGVQETNYMVIYQFKSPNTEVSDLTGYGYTGTLNSPLDADQTFTTTKEVTIPSDICLPMSQSTVSGFYFNFKLTSIPGSKAIFFSIKNSGTLCYQFYAVPNGAGFTFAMTDSGFAVYPLGGVTFSFNTQYAVYFLFRLYSGLPNDDIESLAFIKDIGTSSFSRILSTGLPRWISSICTLTIGHTTEGITGTITDFRLWVDTGAIPGDSRISEQNCPEAVGLKKGTHDPCYASCSDINCIVCTTSTICEACGSGYYLLDNGADPVHCVASCPYGSIADPDNVCIFCSLTSKFVDNGSCVTSCPDGWGADSSSVCVECTGSTPVSHENLCVAICPTGFGKDGSNNCVICENGLYSHEGVCTATCPGGWGARTSPNNACVECTGSTPYSYNNGCTASCPSGYGADGSNNCVACTGSTYSYNSFCVTDCPGGWEATSDPNNACVECTVDTPVSHNDKCYAICPIGFGADASNDCVECTGSLYSYEGVCTATCPAGWGARIIPNNACVVCTGSTPVSSNNLCVSVCPTGYGKDGSNNCVACTGNTYSYNSLCISTCPGGWGATTGPNTCVSCVASGKVSHDNLCVANCPPGWGSDSTICVACSLNGTYSYNYTCVQDCPYGYTVDTSRSACIRCPHPQYFFNHTCLTSCPTTTFANSTVYECQPCYLGCDSCADSTNSTCIACSAGYFLDGGYCGSGCPSAKFPNFDTRTCESCPPPCVTCSQPNSLSCTSCPANNFLLDGTCVTSCPITHYESFLGNASTFQVAACLLRLGLVFELELSSQARTVYINFNYSITEIIQAVAQLIKIEIGSVEIDSASYVLTPLTDSIIKFQYIGDQYYPSLSVLTVTLDLQSSFNYDPYQKFRSITKSATIKLKEIYPFSPAEIQVIGTTANFTSAGGATIGGGQAASSVAGGALSLSLVRMQIIGEIVQLLRLIDINWPPNVQSLFSETEYDPSSIVVEMDLIQSWNQFLEDRNTSLPRNYQVYEVDLFFSENYSSEISNIFVLSIITVFGVVITSYLRKKLQRYTSKHTLPKTNAAKSCRSRLVRFLHYLSRALNRFDSAIFWNFAMLFTLAIFQPGVFWSLLNINYYSTLIEPPTPYTHATLAIAIISLILYLSLMGFVFYAVISNFKYLINTKESLWPTHIKPYRNLFEDFDCENKLQLLFVPISMLKSLFYAMTLVFLPPYPIAQIAIIWGLSAAFIVYMIIKRPLKDKWTRIITLVVELFGFGCMSIGLVLPLIEKAAELDASTRDEIGFVFIAFTIISTLAGGLLALIQVLALIIDIYKYLREKCRRRWQVKPLNLDELYPDTPNSQELNDKKAAKLTGKGESMVKVNSCTTIAKSRDDSEQNLFKYIGSLSSQVLSQSPRGMKLLENMRMYHQEHSEQIDLTNGDILQSREEKRRAITDIGDRISLFPEN